MHMPPRPGPESIQAAIVLADTPAGAALAEQLRLRLAPQRWPLAPELLPAETVLVGGAVRDAALGRLAERPDLDFVVARGAVALAGQLARRLGGTCVVLDAERDIARLVLAGWTIDLARQEGPDLISDLRRRDYSVNALALPLQPGRPLLDPTGGLGHLQRRQLVAISEANLLADPLRLLRGLRLAAELDFSLEPQTLAWINGHGQRLAEVAGERVLAELEKLAAAPGGSRGLELALRGGLLEPWGRDRPSTPETTAHRLAGLTDQAAAARGLSPSEQELALPLARLAAVLGPAGLARLRSSRRLQQRCGQLRHWSERLQGQPLEVLPEAERLQLQLQLEADLPALLLQLPVASARAALQRWRNPRDPLFHPRPPIDGHALQQALQRPAGRWLGPLLAQLTRERAFGRLGEDRDAVLAAARRCLAPEQTANVADHRT